MLWIEFLADAVTFKTVTVTSGADGAPVLAASTGTALSAMVNANTVNRITDQGELMSATAYTLYLAAEPTDTATNARATNPKCRPDDLFVWGSKTLIAMGPALDMSTLGESMFKVECVERV